MESEIGMNDLRSSGKIWSATTVIASPDVSGRGNLIEIASLRSQ